VVQRYRAVRRALGRIRRSCAGMPLVCCALVVKCKATRLGVHPSSDTIWCGMPFWLGYRVAWDDVPAAVAGCAGRLILNPKSNFLRKWDLVVVLLMLYTATFTPFEEPPQRPPPIAPIHLISDARTVVHTVGTNACTASTRAAGSASSCATPRHATDCGLPAAKVASGSQ
jgi:hypothetical protein